MFVSASSTSLYGCTFSLNICNSPNGPDIFENEHGSGTTIYAATCLAGFASLQGAALSIYGPLSGSLFSYTCSAITCTATSVAYSTHTTGAIATGDIITCSSGNSGGGAVVCASGGAITVTACSIERQCGCWIGCVVPIPCETVTSQAEVCAVSLCVANSNRNCGCWMGCSVFFNCN